MNDLSDVPDLRNTGDRVRRLVWTVAVGAFVALIGGWIAYLIADPNSVQSVSVTTHAGSAGAWRFVGTIAGGAGFIGGAIAFAVHRALSLRRARQLPPARVVRDSTSG